MRHLILITFFILPFISGCSKEKIDKESAPKCIRQKFSSSRDNQYASVDQHTFQGKTVFTFSPDENIADGATEVVDENCHTLGSLGGISGNGIINGEDFSKAQFVKNIWKQ